jgi:hypothetical protein
MYNGVKAMIEKEFELTPVVKQTEEAACYAIDPKEDADRANDLIQCGLKMNEVTDL